MKRQSRRWYAKPLDQLRGRVALWAAFHEQPKYCQPRYRSKRAKSSDNLSRFHDSNLIELYTEIQGALASKANKAADI